MAILEKEVWINLNNKHKHYKELGYNIPTSIDGKGKYKAKIGTKLLVKVNHLPKSSNFELTKICDKCGENIKNTPYFAILKQRKNNDDKDLCKTCAGRFKNIKKAKGNSVKTNFPNIAKEWLKCLEYGCEEYTPDMVTVKSNYSVLWKCQKEECGHKWEAKISDRTNGSNCPACWGRVVSDKNRLSIFFPELVKEWHPFKNGELTPNSVTYSSHNEVWWKCNECNNEWETPIYSRTVTNSNCPRCAVENSKLSHDEFVKRIDLSLGTEYQILGTYKGSYKSIKLKHTVCNHIYNAIASNAMRGSGCPLCNESKGEKIIRKWLDDNNYKFNSQKEFEGLIGTGGGLLSYDFYLPIYNLLIEYQGEFHDGSGGYLTKDKLKKQQEHDRRKREYAEQNGIELFEIWYWSFDNIEEILDNKLNNI